MSPTDDRLPLFVFGTLRVGHSNHRYLAGKFVRVQDAKLPGYRKFQPLMIEPAEGTFVPGELFTIKEHLYEETLRGCDSLEGIPAGRTKGPYYDRIAVEVALETGTARAWAYVKPT